MRGVVRGEQNIVHDPLGQMSAFDKYRPATCLHKDFAGTIHIVFVADRYSREKRGFLGIGRYDGSFGKETFFHGDTDIFFGI